MNSIEVAARNWLANTYNLTAEEVDYAMSSPGYAEQINETVAKILVGPFGTLTATDDLDDTTLVDATLDGYVAALRECIQHIDNGVIEVPTPSAAISVHRVLGQLKQDIQDRIAQVELEDVDEEDQLALPLAIIFGFNPEQIAFA